MLRWIERARIAVSRKRAEPRGWRLWLSRAGLGVSLLAIGAGLGLYAAFVVGLRVNSTTSMPLGVYRVVGGTIERGATAVGCLPPAVLSVAIARGYIASGPCPPGGEPVVKRVAGLSGDRYVVSKDAIVVAGVKVGLGGASLRDPSGRPMTGVGAGVIPAGSLFLVGESADSWDSRYFGPVDSSAFQRARGVWLWSSKEPTKP